MPKIHEMYFIFKSEADLNKIYTIHFAYLYCLNGLWLVETVIRKTSIFTLKFRRRMDARNLNHLKITASDLKASLLRGWEGDETYNL